MMTKGHLFPQGNLPCMPRIGLALLRRKMSGSMAFLSVCKALEVSLES